METVRTNKTYNTDENRQFIQSFDTPYAMQQMVSILAL